MAATEDILTRPQIDEALAACRTGGTASAGW